VFPKFPRSANPSHSSIAGPTRDARLGFGDIVPAAPWLRIAVPLQALVGFVLLTAAVSWVLQIYPALSRRRALAVRLTLLHRAGAADSVAALDASILAEVLENLATEIVQVRVDLTQYAETYYFHDSDPSAALPGTLAYAADLSTAGRTARRADVRLSATLLAHAVEDLAHVLDRQFLHVGGTTNDIIATYAAEHRMPRAIR
jgi:hypothetical protein